ncbi:MAG: DMT family transporter [Gammaproteobacteria bacterium]
MSGLWHRYPAVAYAAVMLGVLGHGSSEFVSVLSGVHGPETSVWRFMLGAAGLVVVSLAMPATRDLWTPLKEQPAKLLALSALGVTGGYLFFHWALDFATVVQVATITTTAPIIVAIINRALNNQRIGVAKWISGVCALLGVALLVTDGYVAQLAGTSRNLFGMALVLISASLISAYTVMVRPIIARYGALRITTVTMAIGAAGLWLVLGLLWNVWANPARLFHRPASEFSALLVLALWNTTITQFLWIGGLAAVPDITRGMYLFFLKPVIAALLAAVILQQLVTPLQWLAISVICASVVLEALWPRLSARRPGGRPSSV